jgi:transposase-like protein
MDETYIKIKGKDAYLYRAVDSEGNTIDFCPISTAIKMLDLASG